MKPRHITGSVAYYPLYTANSVADFALFDSLPDEAEWEVAACEATHDSVLCAYRDELGGTCVDALRTTNHESLSRQVFAVTLAGARWTLLLYEMGSQMSVAGRARLLEHSAALSRRTRAAVIALWGMDFTVFRAGDASQAESLLLGGRAYEGGEDAQVHADALAFLTERTLVVPPMSRFQTASREARLALFGVEPPDVERVSLITVPRVHWVYPDGEAGSG